MIASSIIAASAAALIGSVALLALLGLRDPKRLRTVRGRVSPLSTRARGVLASLVVLPGIVLACFGLWWPLLIWLAASCIAGWTTAHLLATPAT
jgi:hypothetical protein